MYGYSDKLLAIENYIPLMLSKELCRYLTLPAMRRTDIRVIRRYIRVTRKKWLHRNI